MLLLNVFLKSVTCSTPFELEGIQVSRITFVGQSFMLHQIRKMIAMVILTIRHSSNENLILNAMGPVPLGILLAPGEFLTLDRVAFNSYNRKLQNIKSEFHEINMLNMKEREEFKFKHIYPAVLKLEKDEALVRKFLSRVDSFKAIVDNKEIDLYVYLKEASKLSESTAAMITKEQTKTKKDSKEKIDWL